MPLHFSENILLSCMYLELSELLQGSRIILLRIKLMLEYLWDMYWAYKSQIKMWLRSSLCFGAKVLRSLVVCT